MNISDTCGWSEGMSAKIGKVKRIKFYKDERGGLKVLGTNNLEQRMNEWLTFISASFCA